MINSTMKTAGKLKKGVYRTSQHSLNPHLPASRFQKKNFQVGHNDLPPVSPYNTTFEKLPF